MSRCDDYCCNHGCNQGRNCPARVAPIGRRTPRYPEQVPMPPSRIYLRHIAKWILITVAYLLALAFALALMTAPEHRKRRIDCTTAEWHPDVPPAAKAKCRDRFL